MCIRDSKQDHGEKTRSFVARVRGKASTCGYQQVCCGDNCQIKTDFSEIILKDVLIAGLVDEEIKKEVLGWVEVDDKTVEETLSFIEGKEMARDAMNGADSAAPISSYKSKSKPPPPSPKHTAKSHCQNCNAEMDKFVWNTRLNKNLSLIHI